MLGAQSTYLVFLSIIKFVSIHQYVLIYENSCNTVAATLLRLLWVLLTCYIIVDTIHFKGHQFKYLNDADRSKYLDKVLRLVLQK